MQNPYDSAELIYNDYDIMVAFAAGFATAAHASQKYGDKPYTHHLQSVWQEVINSRYFKVQDEMNRSILEKAAWLHDVLEDTSIKYEGLLLAVSIDVADLVLAVTDEPGKNRKERKSKTYPKIREYGSNAILLKLADRIANVKESKQNSPDLFKMYQKEMEDFRNGLFNANPLLQDMWDKLDNLINCTNC